jgi:hypothetical protein
VLLLLMMMALWWQAHEEHVDETSWIGYIAITKDGQTHLGKHHHHHHHQIRESCFPVGWGGSP